MIYAIPIENYPKNFLEEISYRDENDMEWKICRTADAFYVRYFGNEYFMHSTFECEMEDGYCVSVRNTNCIQFKTKDFDDFWDMRNIIKLGYTDDIWESIEEFFTERLLHDKTLLESERVSPTP